MTTLKQLNTLSETAAFSQLEQCCVSNTWINKMVASRPFSSVDELISKAAAIWYQDCNEHDFLEAFSGHPKIGNVESLKEKFAHTADWANNEQAEVAEASMETINALASANTAYEKKFGYIFIVSASGKSADEMLAIINARLTHQINDELSVAMNEQHKITVIRLAKLIEGLTEHLVLESQLTTHALDTSIGVPASHMLISLKGFKNGEWRPMSVGITNKDGRIADVLPPGKFLEPADYIMTFNTKNYYETHGQKGFYPEVSIQFTVTDKSHYHIPLLINPYGYSTYRGS
ncbi:MAG: 2-oxo-4-hydroxy-4-carboxy-5-ureidoimidazoline decarboxylase [Flavobacteriaceae bacterium]|nr:2-oxo-4-hydroxy-4-carboxy-5-ureidoimidazoline decarboxylase [Flavobacteriaceae bacterium]